MAKSLKKQRKPELRPQVLQALKLEEEGRMDEAERLYLAILEIDPENSYATNRLGLMRSTQGDHAAGQRLLEISLKSNPASPAAASDYALILIRTKNYEKALEAANRSLMLKPNNINGLLNRASALAKLRRFSEALAAADKAIAAAPSHAGGHNIRGTALIEFGRHHEALTAFQRATTLDPAFADAQLNEGLVRLVLGDFEQGWAKYEWRWRTEQVTESTPSPFPHPHWSGAEPIAGKTLFVFSEQGLGDTIMFARYMPLLRERGAKVIFAVQPSLKGLLCSTPDVTVLTTGDDLAPFDLQCALLSLPDRLGTRLDSIPADIPYIVAPADRVAAWRVRLPQDGRPKIGLVASGGPGFLSDRKRSAGFAALAPLLGDPRFTFVSLHRDLREADAAVLAAHSQVVHFGEALVDFADTAAVIAELDLVISVDTSVAHLAGAMGKPVWVLLPSVPDFRWLLERGDSPWYPTATLFRQPAVGDWPSVVAQVADRLNTLA